MRAASLPGSRVTRGERPQHEPGFRHALLLAERLRSGREAERLLVLALASQDHALARAVLFQAESRGWDLVAGRHLGTAPRPVDIDLAAEAAPSEGEAFGQEAVAG